MNISERGKFERTISDAATIVGQELQSFTANSNQSSHKLCEYALENVLLHQAAAQQLQGAAANLVSTGQQLLATSRQLTPQLDHLAAMAEVSKGLRKRADKLKQLGATMLQRQQLLLQQQQQQEQLHLQEQQHHNQAAAVPEHLEQEPNDEQAAQSAPT